MSTNPKLSSTILTVLLVLSCGRADAEAVYIVAGSLIDPLNGTVIRDPVVEIQGERIVAVTPGGTVPEEAEVINLEDRTLLPGLADLHTHLTWNPSDFGYKGLAVSITDQAIRGVVNARKTLMAGFKATSVRWRSLGSNSIRD